MGMTIIEKIIKNHSKEEVSPGNIVWLDIDLRSARDFGGANVVANFKKHYPDSKLDDPAKTAFTFDCVVPANNIPYATNQQICRDFAKEQKMKLFDVNMGIGSHVDIDEGLCIPGDTVVGTDSHLNILGSICTFGQGMGDIDVAFTFKTGKTWFEVPPTIKVNVKGLLKPPCTPKDLTLIIVKHFGASGALGKAVEFYGDAIESLSLDGRITLASMVTEMGGIIGLIPPNSNILDYCSKMSGKTVFPDLKADKNAVYEKTIDIDITGLTPQIAVPPYPHNVKAVKDVEGKKVDSVFIGSCTNGRYDDIALVAKYLDGKSIAPNIMMKLVPATRKIYGKLLEEGIIDKLFNAGVIVSHPGCGGCASGQIGMTGKGEVQLSTGNRNFEGKQGLGLNYLVSPATAAVSAINGHITLPV